MPDYYYLALQTASRGIISVAYLQTPSHDHARGPSRIADIFGPSSISFGGYLNPFQLLNLAKSQPRLCRDVGFGGHLELDSSRDLLPFLRS